MKNSLTGKISAFMSFTDESLGVVAAESLLGDEVSSDFFLLDKRGEAAFTLFGDGSLFTLRSSLMTVAISAKSLLSKSSIITGFFCIELTRGSSSLMGTSLLFPWTSVFFERVSFCENGSSLLYYRRTRQVQSINK